MANLAPRSAQPTVEDLREILVATRTIAVVGLSDKTHRPSHEVAAYLQAEGYRIIPVNPAITQVLGQKAYPSLRDVTEPIDVVDVFRRPEFVPEIVEDAIAVGAKVVWMQLGIVQEQAAARARAAGLTVVMNTCMATTHDRLRSLGRL